MNDGDDSDEFDPELVGYAAIQQSDNRIFKQMLDYGIGETVLTQWMMSVILWEVHMAREAFYSYRGKLRRLIPKLVHPYQRRTWDRDKANIRDDMEALMVKLDDKLCVLSDQLYSVDGVLNDLDSRTNSCTILEVLHEKMDKLRVQLTDIWERKDKLNRRLERLYAEANDGIAKCKTTDRKEIALFLQQKDPVIMPPLPRMSRRFSV